jgi:methionine-rich copper-binding protein CopC
MLATSAEDGATVSAPVRRLERAGQYTIAYRVPSADGHPVRGAVRFTLVPVAPCY